MWRELIGTWGYKGGANGSVTIPVGAVLIQIVAHASPAGTVTIFGGDSIPLPPNDVWSARFNHTLLRSLTGADTIVFSANVTSYFVEYVKAGNT